MEHENMGANDSALYIFFCILFIPFPRLPSWSLNLTAYIYRNSLHLSTGDHIAFEHINCL